MFTTLKLFFKLNRLKVAILVAVIVTVANFLISLLSSERYSFLDSVKNSVLDLGLYLIVTPILMVIYYFYKKQQIKKQSALKEVPEIFNLNNYLLFFTLFAFIAFLMNVIIGILFKL